MKLSGSAWLDAGLTILTQQGPEFLKVDVLCRHLKVTKGSFYHHFQNREDYVLQLLNHWLQANTLNIIEEANKGQSPSAKSDILDELAMAADVGPERAMRSWGQYNKTVSSFVEKVDKQRIDYLAALIGSQSNANRGEVLLVAKLAYAHFVGCQQLSGVISKKEWADMSLMLRHVFTQREGA